MYCSRLVINLFSEFQTRMYTMYTTSKVPNYYEVLKITQYSTQDDIKSAYYRLSKQYHPDKNKTLEAKQIFQNISDAYEILSNLQKRVQYDRQLNLKPPKPNYTKTPVKEPEVRKVYNVKSNYYYSNTYNKESMYNFDEWTRQHYSDNLRKTQELRQKKESRKSTIDFENDMVSKFQTFVFPYSFIIVILFFCLQYYWLSLNYDKNVIKRRNKAVNN